MPDMSDEQHEVEARASHRLAWSGTYSRERVGSLLRLLDAERARADAAEAATAAMAAEAPHGEFCTSRHHADLPDVCDCWRADLA